MTVTTPLDYVPQLVDSMSNQWRFNESAEHHALASDAGSDSHSQSRARAETMMGPPSIVPSQSHGGQSKAGSSMASATARGKRRQ